MGVAMNNGINGNSACNLLPAENISIRRKNILSHEKVEDSVIVNSDLNKLICLVKEAAIDSTESLGKIASLRSDIQQGRYAINYESLAQKIMQYEL